MSSHLTRVFRPVAVSSTTRLVAGVVLTVLVTAATGISVSLLWLPRDIRYEVTGETLRIMLRTGVWRVGKQVPLAAVTAVEPLALSGGWRQFGTAIPGYCVGRFSYPEIGEVWQATTCGRAGVLIHSDGSELRILVAPADSAGFLAAVSSRRAGSFAPAPYARAPGWIWVKVGMLMPLLLLPLLPAYFFVAPRRLRYEVGQGELIVRTLLLTKRFPLAGRMVRAVTPGKAHKLAGSAVPGYYAGLFYLDGERTRVYGSRLTEGVLIEGSPRVFVTPSEPEVFVAELQHHGANAG